MPTAMKHDLIWGITSVDGDSLVVFYDLSASEICLNKRGGLKWEWPYKRGGLKWEWPYKRGGLWWEWPYKRETAVSSKH